MNCDEFRDVVVRSVYGTPTEEDLDALRKHAAVCARCAKVLERSLAFQGAREPAEDAPLPDREASWRVIRERSFARPRRFALPLPSRRLALAAAGVAAVFLVGAIVGRIILFGPAGQSPSKGDGRYENMGSLSVYLQTVEPLLVDFLNSEDRRMPEETAQVTARAVAEMLARTRILKIEAIRAGDRELYELLDGIEIALISISSLGGPDGEAASQLERFIRDEALVPKLRVLASSTTI